MAGGRSTGGSLRLQDALDHALHLQRFFQRDREDLRVALQAPVLRALRDVRAVTAVGRGDLLAVLRIHTHHTREGKERDGLLKGELLGLLALEEGRGLGLLFALARFAKLEQLDE